MSCDQQNVVFAVNVELMHLQNGPSIVIKDTVGTLVQVRGIVSCFAANGRGPQRRDEVQQGTVCHEIQQRTEPVLIPRETPT